MSAAEDLSAWRLIHSGGRRCSILGTPLFPLFQSGGEEFSSDEMNEVSQVELGLAEELVVGAAGDEFPETVCLTLSDLDKQRGVMVGFELLLGS